MILLFIRWKAAKDGPWDLYKITFYLLSESFRWSLMIFLSLRVFGLLSSSLLLFPQRFGRYVHPSSSGVCRTRGIYTELQTGFFNESTGVVCSDPVSHNRVQVLSIPILLLACSQDRTYNLQMMSS